MKLLGAIEHLGGNNYMVKGRPFTCCSMSNIGVSRKLKQFASQKIKLEVWIRDQDGVLLGVRIK